MREQTGRIQVGNLVTTPSGRTGMVVQVVPRSIEDGDNYYVVEFVTFLGDTEKISYRKDNIRLGGRK